MKKKFIFLFVAASILPVVSLAADSTSDEDLSTSKSPGYVMIGGSSGEAPEWFSVLELESKGERGLRLPQLTEAAIGAMKADFENSPDEKQKGLRVYDTENNCVKTWNGSNWVEFGKGRVIREPGS